MHLAQELVDHIIDFLHNDPAALIQVSLVSRAWFCRTRTHLCEITRPKLLSLKLKPFAPRPVLQIRQDASVYMAQRL